jgi:hypothetical protein
VAATAYWIVSSKDRWVKEVAAAKVDGTAFGPGHKTSDCVGAALTKADECGAGFVCETRASSFMEGCFSTAKPDPSMCRGVPAMNEIVAMSFWSVAECQRRGRDGSQRCARLMQAVSRYCVPKTP